MCHGPASLRPDRRMSSPRCGAGAVIPAHPLALDAEPPARPAPPARAEPLLHRCRRRRPGGRRAHHAVRHPRGRPATNRCWPRPWQDASAWTDTHPGDDRRPVRARPTQALAEAGAARGSATMPACSAWRRQQGDRGRDASRIAQAVAEAIPLVGFYLQPAVGGMILDAAFWRRSAAIDNVVAIKVAPFNRYRTLDVVRGVVRGRRRGARRALHRQRRPHRARSCHRRSA